ncbi:EAL domain-containing protein [Salmonella enterica]|nr:EAL domain-containing protein [Salmonella enterica]EJR3519434.1 EAL domain-containing protein [Salmonella enterica]
METHTLHCNYIRPKLIHSFKLEPIYDIFNKKIIGAEVLSKLSFSSTPETWFQHASDCELWSIIRDETKIISSFYELIVFINIPYHFFSDKACFNLQSIHNKRLVFELQNPHSLIKSGYGEYCDTLNYILNLKNSGVEVWLDDVDENIFSVMKGDCSVFSGLKVDKYSFWRNFETNKLEDLINTMRYSNKALLIEGVETPEHLAMLKNMSVQYCQGYLWPASHIEIKE